ncbi:zinc ribbon domain-containing protein [Variovorax sp. EL159]|uniref:zinc ribbon domain-containing protein n=1 Tax=Variovorax sp. EL159 TaxID=1566270 RepID=UPI00088D6AB3|nr:zinc ribbon domain-containing protein [Variovorax sp. EL159]SCX58807.1 hypothetical protein SAMN03159363_1979 [Variovorax sp. EL159]
MIFSGFFFFLLLCVGAGIWASNRGRFGVGWFFISIIVSPVIAFILLAVMKDLSKDAAESVSGGQTNRAPAPPPGPVDDDYAVALEEATSGQRKAGIWAKAFTDAVGDKDRTVALYTARRAQDLADERNRRAADELRQTEEGRALLAQQAYDALPKGTCPNCGTVIPLDSPICPQPKCGASFDAPDGWRIKPLAT